MATPGSINIRFPKESVSQLTTLSDTVSIPPTKNKQNVVDVLGKAVRLLTLATEADEINIKMGHKTYKVDIRTL